MLSLQKVWALSQRWYGDRMARSFRGRSQQEARAIFAALGLTADFWLAD